MKVISFLGPTDYKATTYFYNGQEMETRFFQAAVAKFFKPDEIFICATPTVRNHANLPGLGSQLDQMGVAWQVIEIPEGRDEDDLWTIFDALTGRVENGETVIFDVTHSFRSLPFLAFLAVAYLRSVRNVTVERVLYGAWEARDIEQNRSPVFDLTPFVGLLDWTTATNRFIETGDGQPLAKLLKAGMPSGPQMGKDLEQRDLRNKLKWAAESIEKVSLALQVTRPYEVMESAANLSNILAETLPVITQKARPIAVMAEEIKREYGQFGLEEASEPVNFDDSLNRQLVMIRWYTGRGQVVQAATLMREWIISILAYHFGAPMFAKKGREPIEIALNNAVEKRRENPRPSPRSSIYEERLAELPNIKTICSLWSQVTDLRNDIAHVGMNIQPEKAVVLKSKIENLFSSLEELADVFLMKV